MLDSSRMSHLFFWHFLNMTSRLHHRLLSLSAHLTTFQSTGDFTLCCCCCVFLPSSCLSRWIRLFFSSVFFLLVALFSILHSSPSIDSQFSDILRLLLLLLPSSQVSYAASFAVATTQRTNLMMFEG